MTIRVAPSDLDVAALISSKICHDAINPVSAISHGLQMLDDDKDADSQKYAIDMIRNVTAQASARIEFARIAFGASGAQSTPIDLAKAEDVARRYVTPPDAGSRKKHKLLWSVPAVMVEKDKGKLLLNMISAGIGALPRGGEIAAVMSGPPERPAFTVRCTGQSARIPEPLLQFLAGADLELDAMNVQYYYLTRLAHGACMMVTAEKDGADVVYAAAPATR